jgi:hypothetical protein
MVNVERFHLPECHAFLRVIRRSLPEDGSCLARLCEAASPPQQERQHGPGQLGQTITKNPKQKNKNQITQTPKIKATTLLKSSPP